MPLLSADITVTDVSTSAADYTAPASTVTFAPNEVAMTQSFMLAEDTDLEDLEHLTYAIDLTSDATTMAAASVSASANQAKIFIMDRSSEYNHPFTFKKNEVINLFWGHRRDREGSGESERELQGLWSSVSVIFVERYFKRLHWLLLTI